MSWAPSSRGGGGSTPSPNVNNSLQRIQGMGKLVGLQTPNQQLLPAGAVKQRFLGSQGTTSNVDCTPIQQGYWNRQKGLRSPLPLQGSATEAVHIPPHRRPSKDVVHSPPAQYQTPVQEVVRAPSNQTPEIVDSEGTDDFEHSSVGTWNSPKEQSIGNNSSEFAGAPLPAPLHIIQAAATSTALVLQERSFSTASMALSAVPLSSDEMAAWNTPRPYDHDNDDDMALVQVNPNSLTAVEKWETQQESYPIFNLTESRHPRVDDCDINPATGKLIPPPRYIKIQKDTQARHNWRRAVTNSEGYIARELDLRKTKKEEIERKKEEQKYANMTHEEDKWPDADCTLRPVQPEDFQGIANIINNEMQREEHRRMLVGSALLDRILLSTSIYHRSLVDYNWDCSEPRKTYEEIPAHNKRKYSKLYLETLFDGEGDSRIEWTTRLLEKYDFAKVANFKEAVKHGNHPGVWKDIVVWEHEARPASEIVEEEKH
ncbi:hypothetical protein ACJA88_001577 [Fusarium oxysporum]